MDVSSPSPFRVSLADALDVGVPPTWHEAVAITRQLISALELQGPLMLAPTLAQVHIVASGAVIVSGGQSAPSSPGAGVGHLLGQLLDRAQPPAPLREICQRAVATPPAFESLTALAEALAFFARPSPEAEIAAYYARVAPAIETRPRTAALSALTEKARSAEDARQGRGQRNDRTVRQIAALALVLVAIGSLWLLRPALDHWLASPGGSAARSALDTIGTTAIAARDAAAAMIGGTSSSAPPAIQAPAASPAPATPHARRTAAKARPEDADVERGATLAPEPGADGGAEMAAAPAATGVLEPLPNTAVYSAASAEVRAPALVYPQLPSRRAPGHPGDQPGALELLVLEDGTVGEARLIPASNRLQDRMLVSAAKAWRFQPALRHGQPVRYRLRMPITW